MAKIPRTEGESDPAMKEVDPYMIDALYGKDPEGQTGRLGAEGGLVDLLAEPNFVDLLNSTALSLSLLSQGSLGPIET